MNTNENKKKLVEQFIDILGEEGVLTEQSVIEEFSDPYGTTDPDEHEPLFVVQPKNVEEVQEVVKLAGELDVHIWTSGMGRNFGYGGSSPVVNHSIVLNFRRMNKILEINEEAGYALVEPGVQFFDLYEELQKRDSKLMMSVPDLGWGSIVGNSSQHGYGYTINGEHANAVAGLEVVLANGEVIRTGQGAKSDSVMWQRHERGYGPSIDNLFLQSNFGVITKMGIWLEPQPEAMTTGYIFYDGDDIQDLVERIRPLVMNQTIQGIPLLYSVPRLEDISENRIEVFEKAEKGGMRFPARWVLRLSIFGYDNIVKEKENIVREALDGMDDLKIDLATYPGDVKKEDVPEEHQIAVGIPNMMMLEQVQESFGESVGHIEFAPVIPFEGEELLKVEKVVQDTLDEYGLFGMTGTPLHTRSMVPITMIYFDTEDPDQVDAAYEAASRLVKEIGDLGYTEYRAHVTLMQDVADELDFNDHALNKFYTTIKDAVDPKGTLSPGNHGIWPSKMKKD